MRRGFFRIAAAALIAAPSILLAGCVQMTRHSNTLVFGTNTSFGIKVGTDATSTPGITVGYNRQEAVIMPLVANTADDGKIQSPCPPTLATATTNSAMPAGCLLIGTEPNKRDAYSVLASFGAKFGADIDGAGRKADGQIAQYFATGLAARKLAENAGAAAVALGGAATSASARLHGPSSVTDGISTPPPAVLPADATERAQIAGDRAAVAATVEKVADGGLKEFLKNLGLTSGAGTQFSQACKDATTSADCAAIIRNPKSLGGIGPDQWKRAAAVTA